MSRKQAPEPPRRRARAALASYLRLLAACLEDEADMIENDDERSEEVLRKFRDGVVSLSLDDVPLEAMVDAMGPFTAKAATSDAPTDGSPMLLSGAPATPRPTATSKRRR